MQMVAKVQDKKTYQISSTPVCTPSKSKSLKNPKEKDAELDSLSDISKASSRSSVCSSVSSGLIELLCNYNSANAKEFNEQEEPERDVGFQDQDETLKNEATLSIVIPTDQPNCDGRLKILAELLKKLKSTVNSIISSGDSKSVKKLGKIVETMESEFRSLQNELPALWLQKREFESEIENATAPLKNENAALQRRIRILNQTLAEKEKKSNQKDISLELETVQCMNNTLMDQVKKLSSLLQGLQGEKKKQEEEISRLKKERQKLDKELLFKNTEFAKSQEIFSVEAGTIKTEVANALQKVDALKRQLRETETESELLKVSLEEKDDEVSRLNDLNRGLQSSVSRLLEDLRKASTRPRSKMAPTNEMSSAFLQNLQNVLNAPHAMSKIGEYDQPALPKHSSLIKSYPPLSGKENFSPLPLHACASSSLGGIKDGCNENGLFPPDGFNVLESSRISSLPTEIPSSTVASLSIDAQYIQNSAATTSNRPTLWDQSSVSSFISFTSRDENDFANGLALLDADIQRLQESLHDMSTKNI